MKSYKLAFVGKSISHSLLPQVYYLIGKQLDRDIIVTSFEYSEIEIKNSWRLLCNAGFDGTCVTFPHKVAALKQVDASTLTPRAQHAGSINIIKYENSRPSLSDNTDGIGFINDAINNKNINFTDKKVLLVGGGGTARSILTCIKEQNPRSITICNRNQTKILALTINNEPSQKISTCTYTDIPHEEYDIIINATSASISNELPPLPGYIVNSNTVCLECAYRFNQMTPFAKWALANGCSSYFDGLGMLIEQAAEAIIVLLNRRIDSSLIMNQLLKVNFNE